jgi:TRAP-type C4-dicarboxylate transport system substrate-binding protein
MDTISNLGASAVPMAVGELYTAMAQGSVDGQENPISIIHASKYYEVQKYLSLTGHVYSPVVVLISDSFYKGLPDDLRKIVEEEVANSTAESRREAEKIDNDLIDDLKIRMTVNEIADIAPFRAAVQPVYDDMIKTLGNEAAVFFDRIKAAAP